MGLRPGFGEGYTEPVLLWQATKRETVEGAHFQRAATCLSDDVLAASTMAPLLDGEIGTPLGMMLGLVCVEFEAKLYI